MKASKQINDNYFSIVDQLKVYENHLKRVQNAQQKVFKISKEHELEQYQKYKHNYYRARIHEENIKIQDMNKQNDMIMNRLLKIQNTPNQPQFYSPKKRSKSIQFSSEISKKNTQNLLKCRQKQQMDIQRENIVIHGRLNSQKSIVDLYDIKNHQKKHEEYKYKLTKLNHDKQLKLRDVLDRQFNLQSTKSIPFYLPLIQSNQNKSQINESQQLNRSKIDSSNSKSKKKLRSISQTYDMQFNQENTQLSTAEKEQLTNGFSYYQPDHQHNPNNEHSKSLSRLQHNQTQY